MSRLSLLLLCAPVLVGGCQWLFVEVPEFGLECSVTDGDNGPPLTDEALDDCSDDPGERNQETYLCRSSGPSIDDAAFCVPRACEARGTMFVVNPSQAMQLDQVLAENGGGPCFDGVHVARTAGLNGRFQLAELALVAGDLVLDTAGSSGLRSIRLPKLVRVQDRLLVHPADEIARDTLPVLVIDGDQLETFLAPSLVDVDTDAMSTEVDAGFRVGNGLRVAVSGAELLEVDLSGLVRLQNLEIQRAPKLAALTLGSGLEIDGALTARESGSLGGDDFFFDEDGAPRFTFAGGGGTLEIVDNAMDSCAPVRFIVALRQRGWDGLVLLHGNQTDAADTDCFVEDAVLKRASELCADFEAFPDEPGLRCEP